MNIYKYNIKYLDESTYLKYYNLVDNSLKKHIDSFKFVDDKKRSLIPSMILKEELNLVLKKDINGKPYIKDYNVSISHKRDYVVVVVDKNRVGIDIEYIEPIDLKICKDIFNEEELRYIFDKEPISSDLVYTSDNKILYRFYEMWTKKEALYKCFGNKIGKYTLKTEKFDDYILTYVKERDEV